MVSPFDYEFWRDETREDWKRLNLHWHCHSSRMDGNSYSDDLARRDLTTDLAPTTVRDWLRKPPRSIRQAPRTPEAAIEWLQAQWLPIKAQLAEESAAIPDETRFGTALYDLRCANDVCWAFWLTTTTHLHLAVVATNQNCHP